MAWLCAALVLGACTSGPESSATSETTSGTPPATVDTTTTTSTSPATTTTGGRWEPTEHWVGIRDGEFYDLRSDDEFVPRGVNLLHKFVGGHVDGLFGHYDTERIDSELAAISGWGFNTIRVFLDMCQGCVADGDGVRVSYLNNLADFLQRVANHDLVVLFTSNDLPDTSTFNNALPCCEPFGGYRNSLYLSEEGVEAGVRYFREILGGLIERDAPLEAVLGWQIANEQFFFTDVPPLSLNSGSVTVANGNEYDLGDPDQVRAMAEESLVHYVDAIAAEIRSLDPMALVTIGFFEPNEPVESRPGDNRLVYVGRVMRESTLDFFDLHGYPGGHLALEDYALNYTLADYERTPVLLGEYGAFKTSYADPGAGAEAVARWQAESCGLGFDGWLLWLWGITDDEVWTATEGDDAISVAASPHTRPDPCDPGEYVSDNVAAGRPVVASAEEPGQVEYAAIRAVDDSDGTWWSAGDGPPQWLEIDLEEPRTVRSIEVLIGEISPPGPQRHRLSTRGESGGWTVVWDFDGDADHGDTLVFEPDDPLEDVRHVRLDVLAVDGWVIIHEIRIRGE